MTATTTLTATAQDCDVVPAAEKSDPATGLGARLWTWTYRLLLVAVTALALFATLVPWMIQRSGSSLVTITSGSMTPLLPVGGTVTIHPPADADTLEPGQIITFKAMGNGTVITHRIIRRLDTPTLGGVFYQTKGDANRTADPDLAPAANVIGVVEGELPAWQDLAVSMQTPLGRLFVYGGLFVVIALGEIVDLIGASPRRGAEPDPTDEVTA